MVSGFLLLTSMFVSPFAWFAYEHRRRLSPARGALAAVGFPMLTFTAVCLLTSVAQLSGEKRAMNRRTARHGARNFAAGDPNIPELAIAHQAKLGDRRPLDAPRDVGHAPALQGGQQIASP